MNKVSCSKLERKERGAHNSCFHSCPAEMLILQVTTKGISNVQEMDYDVV